MRGGAADIESRGIQHPGILAEIVFGIEIHVDRNTGWRTSRDEKSFGKFDGAFRLRFAALRGEIAVEIDNAAKPCGRVEKTRGGKIQARDVELGVERSQRGVRFIHGPERPVQLELD